MQNEASRAGRKEEQKMHLMEEIRREYVKREYVIM
jgi:hypothetical protein